MVETQIKTISQKGINELLSSIEDNSVENCLNHINDYRLRAVDYKTLIKKLVSKNYDFAKPEQKKKIEDKNSSFKLLTCTYEGTKVVAKIRDGKLDHITTKVPMTVTFIYDNKGYSFTETVEYKYFFIWN